MNMFSDNDYVSRIEAHFNYAIDGIDPNWNQEKYYSHIVNLDPGPRNTYILWTLHWQVFNGGFDQYLNSCHGQFALDALQILSDIHAVKKAALLKQALEIVNVGYLDKDALFRILQKKQLPIDDYDMSELNKLDAFYYAYEDEDIFRLLDIYLGNTA